MPQPSTPERPLILLTNDDGITSPGLAAAAAALDPLGDLLIVAPRHQQTAMGRSMPMFNDGRLAQMTVSANGRSWPGYGVNASPAQAVQYALLELAPRRPALAVSGINYGENVGVSITVSGTVGAALEAAAHGIPSLAVSLQVDLSQHFSNDPAVDFGAAMHFVRLFAARWLGAEYLPDVDALKIDVPAGATPDTPWQLTRLERGPYFRPVLTPRAQPDAAAPILYELRPTEPVNPGSDVAAILAGVVSVTPLSLDFTSRVDPALLRHSLNGSK